MCATGLPVASLPLWQDAHGAFAVACENRVTGVLGRSIVGTFARGAAWRVTGATGPFAAADSSVLKFGTAVLDDTRLFAVVVQPATADCGLLQLKNVVVDLT